MAPEKENNQNDLLLVLIKLIRSDKMLKYHSDGIKWFNSADFLCCVIQ